MKEKKNRTGSIVMVSIALVFCVGLLSIVADVGYMYSEKKRIDTAVNAGYKAGYDLLRELKFQQGVALDASATAQITQRVMDVIANNLGTSVGSLSNSVTVTFFDNNNGITVTGSNTRSLFFAKIFNQLSFKVQGTRTNNLGGGNSPGLNIFPIGLPHAIIRDGIDATGGIDSRAYSIYTFNPLESDSLGNRLPPQDPNNPDYDPNNPNFDQTNPLFTDGYYANATGTNTSTSTSTSTSTGTDWEGFVPGVEYILKPGSGAAQIPLGTATVPIKVFVPMDANAQSSDNAYIKAYGVAYWCLKINASDTAACLPVEWLLGYRGGSFMLPWGNASDSISTANTKGCALAKRLADRRIKFKIIIQTVASTTPNLVKNALASASISSTYWSIATGATALQDVYNAVGTNVLSLDGDTGYRFPIAVYSSQPAPDLVAALIQTAEIPYGTYKPGRDDTYNGNSCTQIYDDGICAGQLDNYKWIHMHHEDFTGFTGGCDNITDTCYDFRSVLSTVSSPTAQMCPACCAFYYLPVSNYDSDVWGKYSSYRYKEYYFDQSAKKLYTNSNLGSNYQVTTPSIDTSLITYYRPYTTVSSVNYFLSTSTSPLPQGAISFGTNTKFYLNIPVNMYVETSSSSSNVTKILIKPNIAYNSTQTTNTNPACMNWGLRCADRQVGSSTWQTRANQGLPGSGTPYINYFLTNQDGNTNHQNSCICTYGDSERPQCQSARYNWDLATNLGFTDDYPATYTDYWSWAIDGRKLLNNGSLVSNSTSDSNSNTLSDTNDFVRYPNRVQKMKYKTVRLIRDHINKGGFVFSQCFAPETLDIALWQASVYERIASHPDPVIRISTDAISITNDYQDCLAFQNFHNIAFFYGQNMVTSMRYSTINSQDGGSFTLPASETYNPRCQDHSGAYPSGSSGHTDSFYIAKLRTGDPSHVRNLGTRNDDSTKCCYIWGDVNGFGSFTFMGGHQHSNIQTQRLVLDNLLLGAVSRKTASGTYAPSIPPVNGYVKLQFGIVNPTNVPESDPSGNYVEEMTDGYGTGSGETKLGTNYRVTTVQNNYASETDQIVGSLTYAPTHQHGNPLASPDDLHTNDPSHPACSAVSTSTVWCPNYNADVGTFTPTNPAAQIVVPITDLPASVKTSQNASAASLYSLTGTDSPNGLYLPDQYNFTASPRIIGFAQFEVLPRCCFTRIYNDGRRGYKSFLGPYIPGQMRGFFIKYIVKPNPKAQK
ncbi:MAG: hypothetical protein HQM08_05465 [Candidatus Riflebacteria bacterium]|nr:hypothetical protein [Candidatus Riflebacteria bacterium]